MFKLTLQDIALGWFETESPNWLTEDQMKQSFLKRFNPWGDTRRQQQDAWNKLKFNMTKDDVDSFVVDMKTLASILGHNDDVLMEKFKDVFPDPNIEAALIAMDDFALMQKKAKQLVHIYKPAHDSPLASATILGHTDDNTATKGKSSLPKSNQHQLAPINAHTFASSLEPTKLANEDPVLQAETKITVSQTPNKHTVKTENTEDPYPWLDVDDPRRTMTDEEILRLKVPIDKSILSTAEKERLVKLMLENTAAFSIRDEIGTCPYFEVKLKLRDDKPFFVRPYNIREDQKPIIQKEMDRLEKLGIIRKGLTGYSSPVLLVKRKQQNLYRVVTDFRVLNERLVRVNHAFPIVRDCLEAIGASKCKVMSVLNLRDAYHTLPLAEESQKYCGLTPYYGSPTYVYLRMGMGMSCSPALWQQFVHIIWEQLPNKEHYKIIMDDILIFSTKEQHWEDLENLFQVLIHFGLKISPHKCQLFRDKLVYMGLEFLIKDGTAHYTTMRDKCDAIRNMKAPKSVKECRIFCGMVNFLLTFCKNL